MSGADGGGGGQSSKSRPVSAEEEAVGAAANPTRSGQVGKQECSRPRISSRPQSSLERVSPVCLLLFFSLTFSSHPFPLTAPSPFNSVCVCVFAFSLSLSSFAFKFSHFFPSLVPTFLPFLLPFLVLFLPSVFLLSFGQSHRKAIFHRPAVKVSDCLAHTNQSVAASGHAGQHRTGTTSLPVCPMSQTIESTDGEDKWTSDEAWSFKWDP